LWQLITVVNGGRLNQLFMGLIQVMRTKKIALGKLRTLYGPLSAKTYANIILVSDEPLYGQSVLDPNTGQTVAGPARNGISVGGISAICHKSGTDEKFPANIYTPIR
jgi:hypothetical protein